MAEFLHAFRPGDGGSELTSDIDGKQTNRVIADRSVMGVTYRHDNACLTIHTTYGELVLYSTTRGDTAAVYNWYRGWLVGSLDLG